MRVGPGVDWPRRGGGHSYAGKGKEDDDVISSVEGHRNVRGRV